MAFAYFDRVKETSTTTGTGAITLAGAATGGFRAFSSVYSNGDTMYYCITDQAGSNWEVGQGTYNSGGNTLSRNSVYASSNSNAAVNFTSGSLYVFTTVPARQLTSATGITTGTGNMVLATAPTISAPALSGSSSGSTTLAAAAVASGTLTLPAATDTLVGKATTDSLTNKTYDTAGTGNVFKINGTTINAISGNTAKVATTSGSLTNGHVATFDASGNVVDGGALPTSGSLIFLGTVTASNAATAELTSLISSTYDDYVVEMNNVYSSGGYPVNLQTSSDNGGSWATGANNYTWAGVNMTSGSGIVGANGSSASSIGISGSINVNTTVATSLHGTLKLYAVNDTNTYKSMIFSSFFNPVSGGGVFFSGGGTVLGTSAINAIRFLCITGNIYGIFRIYGIAK